MQLLRFQPVSAFIIVACLGLCLLASSAALGQDKNPRPRLRDLGIQPGVFEPGELNAITDVPELLVGQVTLIGEPGVRTGVTAILPHAGNLFQQKVPAGVFVGNAFGKLAGSTQVVELGTLETPIILTNTLAVGTAVEAVVDWTLRQPGNEAVRSVNALVGETNDSGLNDIRSRAVTAEDVWQAIDQAQANQPVAEGNVGAGTGCEAFGFKGGIGTSSRKLPERLGGYTLGILVQANYGGVLTLGGVPVGKKLGQHPFVEKPDPAATDRAGDGSCMIVVATDAPLDARQLERLAARALFGLARTGAAYTHGSGDYAIALTTAPGLRVSHSTPEPEALFHRTLLADDALSPLFQAALEATEEAVGNALLQAETMVGHNGLKVEALPLERLQELLPPVTN